MSARADNPIFYVFYTAAAGAPPFAEFPGIVLFSGKKTSRKWRWGIYRLYAQAMLVPMKPGVFRSCPEVFPLTRVRTAGGHLAALSV